MKIKYKKKLKSYARDLRTSMTKEERKLWYEFLIKSPVRFQRQKPIENYIADFYCDKASLIIEIDGSQHYEEVQKKYDDIRTIVLNNLGFKVIRFTNIDINLDFENVCLAIENLIKEFI